MSTVTLWMLLAGALLASEMFSGTLYLLMLGIGALTGALSAQLGAALTSQVLIASLVGLSACFATWQWRNGRPPAASDADRLSLGEFDAGQTVHVTAWDDDGICNVQYRGAVWKAALAKPSETRRTGPHRIVALDGVRLLIESVGKD